MLSQEPKSTLFSSEWVVLSQLAGPRLPASSAVGLSRQLRRALQSLADEPITPCLSGHEPSGQASSDTHLVLQPLPFVGHPLADGHLQGLALVFPKTIARPDKAACLNALERMHHPHLYSGKPLLFLELGESGQMVFERTSCGDALSARRWCGVSTRWATVLPLALDRNPGQLYDKVLERREKAQAEAKAAVERSLRHIGLDVPVQIRLQLQSAHHGALPANAFPRFPFQRERAQRLLTHVVLTFSEPVKGPLILGAGRFHGLGLCAPLPEGA